jgi:hypothetical protein
MKTTTMKTTSLSTRRRWMLAAIPAAALSLWADPSHAAWCGDRCDAVVTDWNAFAHQVITADDGYSNPMAASRSLAMLHLAMHDAVNAVQPRYASWAANAPSGAKGADATAAAAVAAHDMLRALYPKQEALLRAQLEVSLRDAGIGAAVQQGRDVGARAAAAVVAQRATDGSAAVVAYSPGTAAGRYRYTPGFDFMAAPQWRAVTPFALRAPSQFRVAPPPALDSARYTADFKEVKLTGAKAASARTLDQTRYAAFWYEFSDAGWNRIARTVARQQPQDLWQRARTFALLNAVMADAYIAGWDSKLHHDFWRPVTAIRLAAEDGNARTEADATWEPLLPTPPVQDHPSTHSALGAAAAVVLAHGFGRDRIRFEFASPTALPEQPTRSFKSFSAAAKENAESRVRAGIHFRSSIEQGLRLGERIGAFAVEEMLRVVD